MSARDLDDVRARLNVLRAQLDAAFAPDTAAPGFRGTTPSTGHCAAASVIINEELGGKFLSATVDGVSHWFNRIRAGDNEVDIDITGDQFGFAPLQVTAKGRLYAGSRQRAQAEITVETLDRALRLAERAGLARVAAALERRVAEARRDRDRHE